MDQVLIDKNEELVMRLLHYFITEQNYNPIVLHGAKNEIWLENLDSDYKIVRIVTNYIHNDEQFDFDLFKTKQIMHKIKVKTLTLRAKSLNIFTNIGDNVHFEDNITTNMLCMNIKALEDFNKYDVIKNAFPGIENTKYKDEGMQLFMKLTKDINKKTEGDARMAEDVFKQKKPIVTYAIILINVIIFGLMYILGEGSYNTQTLLDFGASYNPYILNGDWWRLITSAFVHIGPLHLIFNCYSLYIIGTQLESFFGKTKYIIIYLVSAIAGNLLSMVFFNGISAGASGAIFGLLGSLLYFGYHYRVYLGNVIKSQIIPLIIVNLFIGFVSSGINNYAHIGGLIGGMLISMAVGVKYKSSGFEKINGWILTFVYCFFLIYMAFFVKG